MQHISKHVLVIDDEEDILLLIKAMLEEEGYTATLLRTVDTLDEHLAKHPPDMLVIDMLLSGVNGRDVIKQMKSQPETRALPLLVLSAHPSAEQEAMLAGADAFLAKPFEMDEFLAMVAKYVG